MKYVTSTSSSMALPINSETTRMAVANAMPRAASAARIGFRAMPLTIIIVR
ncbi:hypothetical protein D9M70_488780 [compost metagenome]